MKFIISTQELNYLINKMQNVVSQKPTVPILSNFLIEAYNDELVLTATDLTVGIRCFTEAKILEEGATTLPAKKLSQLVRELTAKELEISSTPKEVTTIIAGSSRFKLNGMSKSEFPSLPNLSDVDSYKMKQSELKDLLHRTSFAVSKEDTRYALTGLLMSISHGAVTFAGTDGKRLARTQQPIQIDPSFINLSIIPLKAVEEIEKCLMDEGDVTISMMPDKIAIEANQTLIVSKLLTGEYPDVDRIIPENPTIIVSLHREELISLLRQISLFNNTSVRFCFEDGELKISANAMEVGEGDVSMPLNYQGEKLEIAFNPAFFIDLLRHCKEETVTLGLTDPYNPGIVTDGQPTGRLSNASPLYIIMPMRLSEA